MTTSIHVKFRNSTVEDKDGTLYFQLIHKRKIKLITTRFKLYPHEWDSQYAKIRWENVRADRLFYLQNMDFALKEELRQMRELIGIMDKKGEYSIDELAEHYVNHSFNGYLFPFVEYRIKCLNDKKQRKTASIYATVQRSFSRFRFGRDIRIEKIDNEMLLCYEIFLKSSGVRKNSISCYMRALRAIYNQAVRKGLTTQKQPFAGIYTGVDRTIKRAVSEEIITKLKNKDLSLQKELAFARDLFMFSFYMRGISFVDMANLQENNSRNGYITYTRSKTKQVLTVKIEDCMKEILSRYKEQTVDNYLLPIYRKKSYDPTSHLRTYNKRLKRLSDLLGLQTPLSSYVSRHSWATLAHRKGIAIEIISESMGHENETTTRIYLASLGQAIIDRANAKIIALK